MGVGKVLNEVKPYLYMVLLMVGFSGMYIVSVASLKRGMSHFVLVVYRNIVATVVMAPLALLFERGVRPKMTPLIFVKVMGLALLEYACAGPEHVLPGKQADLGGFRLGPRQHPPGRDLHHGAHPEDGEAEAAQPPQPGQDLRHRLHRRRRRAHDPLPRPRRAVPVVVRRRPSHRRRRCRGQPEQRLLAQRHRHDHRQLRLLGRLLRPPVQHAAELPGRDVPHGAHLWRGLRDERRGGARGGAPRHERLGHRLRHPPLHRRLLRSRVLRRGVLCAGASDAGARPGVRDGVPASLHDLHQHLGLHHPQRRDHLGKRDRRGDHSGGSLRPHLGQEPGPPRRRQGQARRRRRAAHRRLVGSHRQRQRLWQATRARRRPCRRRRRDAGRDQVHLLMTSGVYRDDDRVCYLSGRDALLRFACIALLS